MQLLISLFGGLLVTLHIGDLPTFQVPLPFTVWRLAFGVRRSAFGVLNRTRPRRRPRPRKGSPPWSAASLARPW